RVVLLHHATDIIHGLDRLEADGLVERILRLDLNDEAGRLKLLEEVKAAADFDGLVTFVEFGLPAAAWLAGAVGLGGNAHETVRLGRDKERTRQRSLERGVDAPRFYRIHAEADLPRAADAVGFPAVLKPVAGVTGIEVNRVLNPDRLKEQYRATQELLRNNEHPNPGMLRDVASGGYDMILEE